MDNGNNMTYFIELDGDKFKSFLTFHRTFFYINM